MDYEYIRFFFFEDWSLNKDKCESQILTTWDSFLSLNSSCLFNINITKFYYKLILNNYNKHRVGIFIDTSKASKQSILWQAQNYL